MSYHAQLPKKTRDLRACLGCKLVKQAEQFRDYGCENCRHDSLGYMQYTTPVYHGLIALTTPDDSWTAIHYGLQNLQPGIYAMSLQGSLEE